MEFDIVTSTFFWKRLKWNILPNQSVFSSTKCSKEKTTKSTKYLQTEHVHKVKARKEITLSLCPT